METFQKYKIIKGEEGKMQGGGLFDVPLQFKT